MLEPSKMWLFAEGEGEGPLEPVDTSGSRVPSNSVCSDTMPWDCTSGPASPGGPRCPGSPPGPGSPWGRSKEGSDIFWAMLVMQPQCSGTLLTSWSALALLSTVTSLPQLSLGTGTRQRVAVSSPAHMAGMWEGDTDPGAVQGVCLPAPPSLLWSLVLLLVQVHLVLPAQWKEKKIQHGAHLDVLRQRLCCITNTCLPGLGEYPLNQCLYRH